MFHLVALLKLTRLVWDLYRLPSGELTFCHGKIHHFIAGKIHYKWPFSIAMLVHQRVTTQYGTETLLGVSHHSGIRATL